MSLFKVNEAQSDLSDSSTRPENSDLILGVLLARNEWPLLGICVTHALTNLVDELLVIDHSSTDETMTGLSKLKLYWGDRLRVAKLSSGTLHQEELNLLTINLIDREKYSWIYHIDADEFLFVSDSNSLRSILMSVPDACTTARYELLNFVAPSDFDKNDLSRYHEIIYRSELSNLGSQSTKESMDSISNFRATFLDIPFPSKVIYRSNSQFWPTAGVHRLLENQETFFIDQEKMFAAHLPFVSYEHLIRRANHGQEIRDAGYPKTFAWQSQIIHSMRESGHLDRFWYAHSVNAGLSQEMDTATAAVVIDQRLSGIFKPAVKKLQEIIELDNGKSEDSQYFDIETVTLATATYSIRQMKAYKDSVIFDRNIEIRNLKAESARLQKKAEAANKRSMKIYSSLSWRITKPARLLDGIIRSVFIQKSK